MGDLKRTIGIFLDDCPDASYEDFLEAFGSPADMAAEMLRDVPEQEIAGVQRYRKLFLRALIVCMAAVTIGASSTAVFLYWQRENNPHEITTMVYEDKDDMPEYMKNMDKYGLDYQLDKDGNVIEAYDNEGNIVEVDSDGKPLDQSKYESADGTLSEETE
ncbi:hypothetical protein [Butyricicoccus sp.]|uniref:hypothetical protein n=1 Tax=Butyricicoccus sp. TaxID=2049021 RepID=UPI003F17E8DA